MTVKHFLLPPTVFVGRVKRNVTLPLPSGEELYDMVSQYDDIVFDFKSSKQNFSDFS